MEENLRSDIFVPEGDLNVLVADTGGKSAIGFISIVWIIWIIVSMLVNWPNAINTGTYNPPITYIWTLTDN
jgi:hypothetical protein